MAEVYGVVVVVDVVVSEHTAAAAPVGKSIIFPYPHSYTQSLTLHFAYMYSFISHEQVS